MPRKKIIATPAPLEGEAPEPKTEWTRPERQALVRRAIAQDATVKPELSAMLDAHPETVATLAASADPRRQMVQQVAPAGDMLLVEVMTRQAAEMEAELAGECANVAERMLAKECATAWLALSLIQGSTVSFAGEATFEALEHRDRMVDAAQRRYLRAMGTLAKVRRLLRPEVRQINIAEAGAAQLNTTAKPRPRSSRRVVAALPLSLPEALD